MLRICIKRETKILTNCSFFIKTGIQIVKKSEGGGVLSKFHSGIKREEIIGILESGKIKIHFVGVGGVGMYSLCLLTHSLGYEVSGSDREDSELCRELISHGCKVSIGHSAAAAFGAGMLVYSLAVSEDNPELLYAESAGIKAVSRAEYLGAVMTVYKARIGISGSHGKSTTTAMISRIFDEAGRMPTTLLGARFVGGSPLTLGERDYLIYESCEYKDSFLRFSPTVALFTNLEYDHVDYFKSFDALADSFLIALQSAPRAIVNLDDENLRALIPKLKRRPLTFGESCEADVRGVITHRGKGYYNLEIYYTGVRFSVNMAAPGRYNAKNALAAAAVSLECGIPHTDIKSALECFSGIERRLEVIGERDGRRVYYDYAHHPTEIRCAIEAVREAEEGKICVIFKPHTYSRTAEFLSEFAKALSLADEVMLCEISAIREEKIKGVSSERLCGLIGTGACVVNDREVGEKIKNSDARAVIIMGAANLDIVKRDIIGK